MALALILLAGTSGENSKNLLSQAEALTRHEKATEYINPLQAGMNGSFSAGSIRTFKEIFIMNRKILHRQAVVDASARGENKYVRMHLAGQDL